MNKSTSDPDGSIQVTGRGQGGKESQSAVLCRIENGMLTGRKRYLNDPMGETFALRESGKVTP